MSDANTGVFPAFHARGATPLLRAMDLRVGVAPAGLPRRRLRGKRACHLSLINVMPASFGFHLSFICDMLDVLLATYRLFHASTGTMSVLFRLLHVVIQATSKPSFKVGESWQMFVLISSAIVYIASLLLNV